MTLVMKFGGTSVGSADAIRDTADLVKRYKETWGQVVVVASAMGSKPVKVTDLLLKGSQTAASGDRETYKQILTQLRGIHFSTIDELIDDAENNTALKQRLKIF